MSNSIELLDEHTLRHRVVENENRHIVCACGEEFDEPRPAVQWRTHCLAERKKVEEEIAQEIMDDLRLPVPHDWARDEEGQIMCIDLTDYHDGPRCIRCGVIFCRNCDPEMWGEPCDEQTKNLF